MLFAIYDYTRVSGYRDFSTIIIKKNEESFACFKKTIYLCIAFKQETS